MKERREERLHPPSFERRGPWGMLEPPLLPRGGEGSQKKERGEVWKRTRRPQEKGEERSGKERREVTKMKEDSSKSMRQSAAKKRRSRQLKKGDISKKEKEFRRK
jgi:hypothetical protein